MKKYNPKQVEKKWQEYWLKNKLFVAKDKSTKKKKYVLVEFPYPSGAGLHMGHLRPYVAGDVVSRYFRMRGFEVMFPMGWDAFGLPAENYAIKNKVHPSKSTEKNVSNAKAQMASWGLSFDWSREINSTHADYYKWTQWIFLQLYKKGLAYEATGLINWCPKDKTGLANEEVIDGKCERCGELVEKKELRQWYLKITEYADKLLAGLGELAEWPSQVKLQQENWIGRSEGAEIEFPFALEKGTNFLLLHGKSAGPKSNFLPWLKKELESRGYKVNVPQLPNSKNPNDDEQVEYVLKNCKINDKTVILGHSFGGVVALRLLEKGVKPLKVILAAVPKSGNFLDKPRESVTTALKKGFDFKTILDSCKNFLVVHDKNDHIFSIEESYEYSKELGGGLNICEAKQSHFDAKIEPVMLEACLPDLKIFTTRPDTIFGVTYMVISPEHPLVQILASEIKNFAEVKKYIEESKYKTEIERSALDKEKTGVLLEGVWVKNPSTGENVPVWMADYVLMGYGTGAIMAVPAHDERDKQFAEKYNIPILEVIDSQNKLINSKKFNGLDIVKAKEKITKAYGKLKVQYKLRDWLFSRQRYWGEPIPLIHCKVCGVVPVPERDLPVKLPDVKKYEPTGTGESPLAAISSWVNVRCPECKAPAKRETNTMPQWAGSSWYWLRYADPKNKKELAGKDKLKYWTPVDIYFGGYEHTTLHLLYSRFWNLFLFDQKIVSAKEPFKKRVPHGIVLGPDGEKMSKSRGNVVDPQGIVKTYGADTLRLYELFLGPHGDQVAWNDQGVIGTKRFLDKLWYFAFNTKWSKDSEKILRLKHVLIKKITEDIESFRFNTAISSFMGFLNDVKEEGISKETFLDFLRLLYPFAPHIAEELYLSLGMKGSLQKSIWPKFDEKKIQAKSVQIIVQINGKVRDRLEVAFNSSQVEVEKLAMQSEKINAGLEGREVKKVIYVPNKILNIVV